MIAGFVLVEKQRKKFRVGVGVFCKIFSLLPLLKAETASVARRGIEPLFPG